MEPELSNFPTPEGNDEHLEGLQNLVVDCIKHRIAGKGLDPQMITAHMIFRNDRLPTVLELCDWLKLLDNPLLVPADCVEHLLGLRNPASEPSTKYLPLATFYIRTYTLTVAQLKKVLTILLKAKITFKNKIFAWRRTMSSLSDIAVVCLRYAGVSRATNAWGRHLHDLRTTRGSSLMRILHIISDLFPVVISSCLVQEVPHLELPITVDDQSIDIREQMLICMIEQGALNISIGGSRSSNPNLCGKDLFQNLGTGLVLSAARMTQEVSLASRIAIWNFAQEATSDTYGSFKKATTGTKDLQCWSKAVAEQATPRVMKNGRAMLLIVGKCPPAKITKLPVTIWNSDSESSKIMLTMVQQFIQWEERAPEAQEINAVDFAKNGFLPFVNLYPRGQPGKDIVEPPLKLLLAYLQAVRPLMVLCLGHEVATACFKAFSADSGFGLSRRRFFAEVGECSIRTYSRESEFLGHNDCHFVQLTSYHPGALAFGSVSQAPMQRIFHLTMMKAWVAMSEALKYSQEELGDLDICQKLMQDIEIRLSQTSWHNDLRYTKSDVVTKNGELRWRDHDEATTSKSLRTSAAMRINAPSSKQRISKCNSRVRRVLPPEASSDADGKASTPVPMHTPGNSRYDLDKLRGALGEIWADKRLPIPPIPSDYLYEDSHYQGRQLIFKMSYCNGLSASAAARNLQQGFPLQRGDFLWLLDQFLLEEFSKGGRINCADPSVFPNVGSVWPKISRFCKMSKFSRHPFADYLHVVAQRASDGSYGTMQAVVSLKAALEVLRTDVVVESFVKTVGTSHARQRRFTTFVINPTCPDGLRHL